jgi:t-SNARE complex subunit (syntaxin)
MVDRFAEFMGKEPTPVTTQTTPLSKSRAVSSARRSRVLSLVMSALGWVIVAVVVIIILVFVVAFVRRRRRAGGVIATRDEE